MGGGAALEFLHGDAGLAGDAVPLENGSHGAEDDLHVADEGDISDVSHVHLEFGLPGDGVTAMEICMGYQNYQLIHFSGEDDGFDFSKDLKPGDILYSDRGDHIVMFWQYTDYEDGEVGFDALTGHEGFIESEHYNCDSTGKITSYAMLNPKVYRLPNYK